METIVPGSAAQDIGELLSLVHAPDHLAGGLKVFIKLRRILLIAAGDKHTDADLVRLKRYLRALFWFVHNAANLAKDLFSDEADRKLFLKIDGGNPMLSLGGLGAEKHGLWTLLWEHCLNRDSATGFRSLQQHAALSHMELMRFWKSRPDWHPGSSTATTLLNTLYCETRAIRHFVMPIYVEKSEYRRSLTELSNRILSAGSRFSDSDLILALEQIAASHARTDPKPQSFYSDLCSILWLIKRKSMPEKLRQPKEIIVIVPPGPIDEFELENCPGDDRDEESLEGNSEENANAGSEDEDGEQASDLDEGPQVYRRHRWSPTEIEECVNSGTHPAEELPSSSIYLSHRKSGPRVGNSWGATKNRLFPWSADDIPTELLAQGMDILRNAALKGGLLEIELYARAIIILRLGATGPAIRELVVCGDHPPGFENLTLVLPKLKTGKHSEWIIPALRLRLEAKLSPSPGCRRCDDHFVLPDYTGAGTIMRRLLRLKTGNDWNGLPVQPFDRPSVEYDRQLRACFLREDPSRYQLLQSVFTFPRLGEFRFRRIYDHAQENVVPATYLTRREHRTGEVTRFYETLRIRDLQKLDKSSLAGTWKNLEELGFKSKIDFSLAPSCSSGYVGSPFCPTAKALSEFLNTLRQKFHDVNARLAHDPTVSDAVHFHNLYVTYTYVGYNLAVGHRAVIGGYSDPKQVDQRNALMLMGIRDKGLRGRLIPASTLAHAQMRACASYLAGIDRFLLFEKPSLPLFFLDEDRNILEISQSSLRNHIPFVANFGRHYVCTKLVELMLKGDDRITIEYLKEFLGHAAEGEDRAAPDSAFNYSAYALAMREVIDQLLNEIGYWPMDTSGHRIDEYDPVLECIQATRTA